ncbi:MAG: hypothetical protein ACPHN2_12740 [Sinimarinibacterium flocculans]
MNAITDAQLREMGKVIKKEITGQAGPIDTRRKYGEEGGCV